MFGPEQTTGAAEAAIDAAIDVVKGIIPRKDKS